jgi:hypothetical protein
VSQSEGQALGSKKKKYQVEEYKAAVFAILHAPPKDYGFNRTTWRIRDIHAAMKSKGLPLGKNYIMKVIKNEGYRFKNAKIVLTSTDPEYKEKLSEIIAILSTLGSNDRFFSIDEFGPFAIKINRCKINLQTGKAIGWMKLPSPTEFPGRDSIHPGGDESDTIFSSAFRLFVKSDVLG